MASKLWSWLWMGRRWRAVARLRAARRSALDETRAVDVPDGEEVGRLAVAAGVAGSVRGTWRWMTYEDEVILAGGPDGELVTGPGLGTRVVMARRRMRWGVSRASMLRLKRWEIAEGRAESSNHRWAVEEIVSVRRGMLLNGKSRSASGRGTNWKRSRPCGHLPP